MLEMKIISSLEKCFLDSDPGEFAPVERIRIYRNSPGAFQFIAFDESEADDRRVRYRLVAEGDIAPCLRFRCVENVPNYIPVPPTSARAALSDNDYLRTTPGLYPDVLVPLLNKGLVMVLHQQLHTVWVDVENDGSLLPGEYELVLKLIDLKGDSVAAQAFVTVEVLDAWLPEQETIVTQWFHADCLADYYGVEVFSDRHFEICRYFVETAVRNGINMILVPVFTPPLDTAVGGERTTTQLVKITCRNGAYRFDFSLMDRWMDMCRECGVKYYEISHLFTQWGAYHAPKIMAEVDGEYRQIFGWETDGAGEEYVAFLGRFLTELTAHLRDRGDTDNVYFHISDEPHAEHLDQYRKNVENVKPYLHGFKQLDALSHVEYYREGLCDVPVPLSTRFREFADEDIPERWVYYCCSPWVGASNRFLSMHSARTRFMGIQMYAHGVKGFLHWGYNFYNSWLSEDCVDPFLNSNGGYWVSGGDAASVYPGRNGIPLESLRLIAFRQGLEDMRVLKLCEQYYPKKEIMARLEEICGKIVFEKCVNDTQTMTAVRNWLDDMIMAKLSDK